MMMKIITMVTNMIISQLCREHTKTEEGSYEELKMFAQDRSRWSQ